MRKLEEQGSDLDHLQEMEEKDIGTLIRYAPGGRVIFLIFMEQCSLLLCAGRDNIDFNYIIYYYFVFLVLGEQWKLVKQYLKYFPRIQLSATVSPITRTVLKVIIVNRFHISPGL